MSNEGYVKSIFANAEMELVQPKNCKHQYVITAEWDGEIYILAVAKTKGQAWRIARTKIKKDLNKNTIQEMERVK